MAKYTYFLLDKAPVDAFYRQVTAMISDEGRGGRGKRWQSGRRNGGLNAPRNRAASTRPPRHAASTCPGG